ncbi:MAG: hypothetical protein ACLRX7_00205 [Acutalibacteraceae bacterium]
MSQGYIGYHLQQAIQFELKSRKLERQAVSVITQVVVDKEDKAFQTPVKPIGMFYTKQEADRMEKEQGFVFAEDAGRGYRRVVASPNPVSIVELPVIQQLVNLKNIVITVGGGGIPVIETDTGYQGIAAVIDKDKSSAKLAEDLNADMLIILTAVERVCIHYKRKSARADKYDGVTSENIYPARPFCSGQYASKSRSLFIFCRTNKKRNGYYYIAGLCKRSFIRENGYKNRE